MREVIEAIDGPICLNVCLNGGRDLRAKILVPGTSGLGPCAARDGGRLDERYGVESGDEDAREPIFRTGPCRLDEPS